MKHIIYLICFFIFGLNANSQNSMENVLDQIEKNNTSLIALRSKIEAKKIGNNTGKYLQNPEVEFHYLWSNPTAIGNRTDITITQGFDFPTAYKHRSDISELKNLQVDVEYKKQLRQIMLQARYVLLELTYSNAVRNELLMRQEHANDLTKSYGVKFETGESNILEYNKVKLALLNISNRLMAIEIEIEALTSTLSAYNGGIEVGYNDSEFTMSDLPEDFDTWYTDAEQNNPILNWIKQEIEVNKVQEKYAKAMSLPKIQAGYMSESIIGENFQGVVVGLSIPLWQNKNTVKYIKGNTLAYEDLETDRKIQFYNRLLLLHNKALKLQIGTETYRNEMELLNNSSLLKKALDSGEISLIEYIYEFSNYYESMDNLLGMELELNKTIAELNQFM